MNFVEYDSRPSLMVGLAQKVQENLENALSRKDRASLVVPGGSTPGPFFDQLSCAKLEWERVDVFLSDERFVPQDSTRSNTKLLKERLFQNSAKAAHLVPFYIEAERPEEVLDEISQGVKRALPIDVLIVGMGTDMHTASLFPDAAELEHALNTTAPVVVVRPDGQPEARLSLSKAALQTASNRYVLMLGEEKKRVLSEAQALKDQSKAPINLVFEGAENANVFYAD